MVNTTEDCAERLLEQDLINGEHLSNCTPITVKHGVAIAVRNYYDRNGKVGCSDFPLS